MRTAESIVDKYYEPKMHWKSVNRAEIIKAINEARLECIKECIEIAHENSVADCHEFTELNIKSLIEQVK